MLSLTFHSKEEALINQNKMITSIDKAVMTCPEGVHGVAGKHKTSSITFLDLVIN